MTTTPAAPAASQRANIDAALLVLKSMGLSLDDLTAQQMGLVLSVHEDVDSEAAGERAGGDQHALYCLLGLGD
jgi:hypothetical protein